MEALNSESGGATSLMHNVASASTSEYLSTRMERLTRMKAEFATALEYEVEASRDHWSEVVSSRATEEGDEEDGDDEVLDTEELFEKLKQQCPAFFYKQTAWVPRTNHSKYKVAGGWVVGERLAEGAQGGIFEAHCYTEDRTLTNKCFEGNGWVIKVFKKGTLLQDLQRQWPLGIVQMFQEVGYFRNYGYNCGIHYGLLLKNGSFGFVMCRYWGDLRKLIDLRMHYQLVPFKYEEVKTIMGDIARGIEHLHKGNCLHRDLKASNVLVWSDKEIDFDPLRSNLSRRVEGRVVIGFDVADYECSVGVVGTAYWRAPEILKAVQSPVRPIPADVFTEKSDAYSYAMTCFEILTGRCPFEELPKAAYDVVIDGARPVLPSLTEPWIKELLSRCWHGDPLERPNFQEIVDCIKQNSS